MSRTAQILEINEYYKQKLIENKKKPDVNLVNNLLALDIMTSGVVVISSKATINDAVELFLNEKVTALVVVDHNDQPIGVFSETDLARFEREKPQAQVDDHDQQRVDQLNRAVGQDNHFHVVNIANPSILDWMTPMIMTVKSDDDLAKVTKTLTDNHIHRVFVQEDQKLVGVISSMDITSTMATILNDN